MCIVAQDAIDRTHGLKLLNGLLVDKTSGGNIIWATDAYGAFGDDYRRDREITSDLLMRRPFRLMSRAEKAVAEQSKRIKAHAEVFTPIWVVKKMVDELEQENPGCFDDPKATFADLYMKSGLYITEIVKRLFNSEAVKQAYPDDKERIRHILREQVYGLAPTRIIYLIATNYILGFDDELRSETKNFARADAAEAAKAGTLEALVEECFG